MRVRKAVPLALAGALVLGCGTPEVPPKVVKLGAVLDRTGPLATAETVTVLDLALDHVNAGLKAAGYKDMQLAYVLTDNKTQPDVAVTRALEIRTSDDVKGIIADGTQVVIALNRTMYDADASNDLNVPIIGTASNGPVINNPNVTAQQEADDVTRASYANAQKWVFRSTMPSSPAGGVIMQIAKIDRHARRER